MVLITLGASLKCYQCNSHNDDNCNHTSLSEEYLQPCDEYLEDSFAAKPFCRKQKLWLEEGREDGSRIVRDCGYMRREDKDCYQNRAENFVSTVCQCDGDGCNSGHSIAVTAVTSLLIPLIA